jgi:hypothetical protein
VLAPGAITDVTCKLGAKLQSGVRGNSRVALLLRNREAIAGKTETDVRVHRASPMHGDAAACATVTSCKIGLLMLS